MSKLLVTGANGQVGQELQALSARYPAMEFHFTDASTLDITNAAAVQNYFDAHQFTYCINCAAYTAVDKAESEAELAQRVNVTGVKNLADACLTHYTQLIHLSTDYVYHNQQNTPFREDDPTAPKSVYARTKLEGEQVARQRMPATMIIRTSWVYSAFGHNFVKTMLRLGKERDELGIVFDQIGTPTYAGDLACAILDIIEMVENGEKEITDLHSIFHYSNEGVTSWYDFAKAIFRAEQIECRVRPIESSAYPTPAQRPHFSLLNKAKITSTFGLEIPHWEDSLLKCLQVIKATVKT